jgi:hypothetical protein
MTPLFVRNLLDNILIGRLRKPWKQTVSWAVRPYCYPGILGGKNLNANACAQELQMHVPRSSSVMERRPGSSPEILAENFSRLTFQLVALVDIFRLSLVLTYMFRVSSIQGEEVIKKRKTLRAYRKIYFSVKNQGQIRANKGT